MTDDLTKTDAGDLVEGLPLSPQEEIFCRAFADPESETYGKPTKSAIAAGYVEPHNAAWKLRRRPRIIARLEEFQETTIASRRKVLSDLEHERLIALAKDPPDVQAALKASELQGKHLGLFADILQINPDRMTAMSKAEELECDRLAQLLLMGKVSDANPIELNALPAAPRGQTGE